MKNGLICQILFVAGVVAGASVWPGVAALAGPGASVVADFNGGNTDTLVDAYPGMAGDGWSNGWDVASRDGGLLVAAVTDAGVPMSVDGGNYLTTSITTTEDNGQATVGRSYAAGIDVSQDHAIHFKYRIEEYLPSAFTDALDAYKIFDYSSVRSSTASSLPWLIAGYADDGSWVVYDGNYDTTATEIDTGIGLQQGVVYDFQIGIRASARTWDVRIENDTTHVVYNSLDLNPDGLGFKGNWTTVGGTLNFNARTNSTADQRQFSIDGLSITGMDLGPYGGMSLVAARFTGGGSDTAPVTDVVDAYVGMPGGGWATPWEKATLRADATVAVSTASPVKSGGEYLSVSAVGTTEATMGRAVVARNYKTTADPGIDWSAEHTIKFTVRIDETTIGDPEFDTFTAFDDRYLMYDAPDLQSGPSATCTWMITAYAAEGDYAGTDVVGQWCFYDGLRDDGDMDGVLNIDTNVDIVAGGVYDFTIVVDPETRSYDATVSDGVHSFTATDLGWRTSAADVGGYLHFGTRQSDEIDVRAFSLDGLVITTAGVPTVPGDTNGDNDVNNDDAAVLAMNWGTNVGTGGFAMGDFNGDEWVNALDAAIQAANWGDHNPLPESASSVPEPSAIVLLTAGLALLAIGRKRWNPSGL